METNKKVAGDIWKELEEISKVDTQPEDGGTYSLSYDTGGFLSIICC